MRAERRNWMTRDEESPRVAVVFVSKSCSYPLSVIDVNVSRGTNFLQLSGEQEPTLRNKWAADLQKQQASLYAYGDGLRAGSNAEFVEQQLQMGLHGVGRDAEPGRDLFVDEAVSEQRQDFAFAI